MGVAIENADPCVEPCVELEPTLGGPGVCEVGGMGDPAGGVAVGRRGLSTGSEEALLEPLCGYPEVVRYCGLLGVLEPLEGVGVG